MHNIGATFILRTAGEKRFYWLLAYVPGHTYN
jgi:hypothetical protein